MSQIKLVTFHHHIPDTLELSPIMMDRYSLNKVPSLEHLLGLKQFANVLPQVWNPQGKNLLINLRGRENRKF